MVAGRTLLTFRAYRITSIRFKELARQIQEIFPDEEEVSLSYITSYFQYKYNYQGKMIFSINNIFKLYNYYVPAYTPRGGKTVIAKGKL